MEVADLHYLHSSDASSLLSGQVPTGATEPPVGHRSPGPLDSAGQAEATTLSASLLSSSPFSALLRRKSLSSAERPLRVCQAQGKKEFQEGSRWGRPAHPHGAGRDAKALPIPHFLGIHLYMP